MEREQNQHLKTNPTGSASDPGGSCMFDQYLPNKRKLISSRGVTDTSWHNESSSSSHTGSDSQMVDTFYKWKRLDWIKTNVSRKALFFILIHPLSPKNPAAEQITSKLLDFYSEEDYNISEGLIIFKLIFYIALKC